jgi:hypothetical protein
MSEIIDFIKENMQEVVIIVVVVLLLLVLINIKGVDLNTPKPESKLVQQVTVEKFSQALDMQDSDANIQKMMASSSEIFCESYLGNSQDLEKACNQLTESNCGEVKCCVFTNDRCVAGDISGPTYKTDKDGKLITMDSYYYLGKCRGQCPTPT